MKSAKIAAATATDVGMIILRGKVSSCIFSVAAVSINQDNKFNV